MTETPSAETPDNFEQARDALRRKVFSVVAHDLRTPLACIIGSLGTLDQMSASLSPEQRDMLIKTALAEAQQLDGFVAEMLGKVRP
ncbi:MAG: histidine kinase dimerization/phospho-acceptor domain-containing protein [Alphaproteobacteria bacterium]|nr:histidine kinase dimerization/phospho-acceptor domain-containing protein [Alphaproteobacteria bacterium]